MMNYTFASATILLVLITDPVGNIPVFANALKHVAPERRARVILREILIAFFLLLTFMFVGEGFLKVMNLSELSLQIGGGVILFLIALRMVFPPPATLEPEIFEEPLIVPLAVPAIAGPSALATVLLLVSQQPERRLDWIAALCVTMLISAVVLVSAERIQRLIGSRLVVAVERLMGLVLVAVTIPAMILEGASMDWSAIYMRDSFSADKFWQGIAVASFAVLQGLMRFYADGVVERFSPAALARVLFVALGLGCVTVVLSPWPILSLIGFAAMGLGTSAIFPLAMSAAAQRNDRASALNIAALAQFSFMIFLLAPPILGYIAHGWGIRAAYAVALPFVLVSLVTAGALGKRR